MYKVPPQFAIPQDVKEFNQDCESLGMLCDADNWYITHEWAQRFKIHLEIRLKGSATNDNDCDLSPTPLNCRLYIDTEQLYFATFEEAKEEAQKHMSGKPELRIDTLIETEGADFYAYEYENKQWVPS